MLFQRLNSRSKDFITIGCTIYVLFSQAVCFRLMSVVFHAELMYVGISLFDGVLAYNQVYRLGQVFLGEIQVFSPKNRISFKEQVLTYQNLVSREKV